MRKRGAIKCIALVAALMMTLAAAPLALANYERNPLFLLPGEVPGGGGPSGTIIVQGSTNPNAGRNRTFLTAEEVAAMGLGKGTTGPQAQPSGQFGNNGKFTGDAHITKCKEWVNVRDDPSTNKPPIGRAYLDEGVTVISWSNDGKWAFVDYSNYSKRGWVLGKFVKQY